MRLPEIEYGGSVPRSSDALEVVDRAQREALGKFAAGFEAMGKELVRTQAQKASAEYEAGLADLEERIAQTPYVTTAFVRDQLGPELQGLDANARKELTRVGADGVEVDRDDVPMWLVAGALHRKRSKELAAAAGQHISAEGWRTEFEAKAGEEAEARRHRLALSQGQAFLEDRKRTELATVEQLVRGRAYDRALETIDSSRLWMPGEKAGLAERVLKQRAQDEADTRENELIAQAEAAARALEAKYPDDAPAALREAQAIPGALGVKVATRLSERDRLREEALNDGVKVVAGGLEREVRAARIVEISDLERRTDYRRLPTWAQADLLQALQAEGERRLRISQLTTDKQWQQELSRFQGLPDREKVRQWTSYQAKVPFAYAGNFQQVYEAARVRLGNSWDSEDVQRLFDVASGSLGWTGERARRARELADAGRRWYDGETKRNQGVPPSREDAAKWIAGALQWGDENGPAWFGGDRQRRFQAQARAEREGVPLRFVPYGPEEQDYPASAALAREDEGAGAPAAEPGPAAPPGPPAGPPAPAPRPPGPGEPPVGTRKRSEELGLAPGAVLEYVGQGRWKRVE